MNQVHLLVDSLTGLERILTTPIPFSYSIQLWAVTSLYIALLVRFFGGEEHFLMRNILAFPDLAILQMADDPGHGHRGMCN